jgi:hypothetical protein
MKIAALKNNCPFVCVCLCMYVVPHMQSHGAVGPQAMQYLEPHSAAPFVLLQHTPFPSARNFPIHTQSQHCPRATATATLD